MLAEPSVSPPNLIGYHRGALEHGTTQPMSPPRSASTLPPVVEVVHPSYQPSKAELEEDMRVNATFDEAVKALVRPVRLRYIQRPPKRPG